MGSDGFMNAEELARYLNLGRNSVYQLAKSGEIASYRIGRKLRFTREDADAYLAKSHRTPDARDDGPAPREAAPSRNEHNEIAHAASFGFTPGNPFVIAGDDVAADIIARALNDAGTAAERRICESYTALVDLYAGEADAAVIHLYDQASNSSNIPYVRRLAPGVSVVVFRLYAHDQGLIVRNGNPKKITSWGALLRGGIRLSNRAKGSGARVLLDEKLRAMEARCETIDGYERTPSSAAIAIRHVANGAADATVGTAFEARGVDDVQLVPLQSEWVDVVVRKSPDTLDAIRSLKELLANDQMQRDLAVLNPSDLSQLGSIVFES